jgi:hypothetical protein
MGTSGQQHPMNSAQEKRLSECTHISTHLSGLSHGWTTFSFFREGMDFWSGPKKNSSRAAIWKEVYQ